MDANIAELRELVSWWGTYLDLDSIDWGEIEEAAGHPFPLDFKRFCMEFPPVAFQDALFIRHPESDFGVEDEWENVSRSVASFLELTPDFPFSIYPEPGRTLIPWGNYEEQIYFWWLAEGEPDDWSVVVTDGTGSQWEAFPGTMTDCLLELLQGSQRLAITEHLGGSPRFAG
ncbi:hypothetical protein [Longispora fulva]|uniref:Knr4/Smi1-like domain-containing protein n=1 Tax=Longispora fulva TaxID=619741 RepID=A0A8J7GGH0_9ACTN|nr:hypothetical protein [Longispora fulva]MBG6136252.1 hypothetical protein [Longispora fulva]